MNLKSLARFFPSWQNALLAVLSALLLVLAFPPFEWWFMAWIALVPLLFAVEREISVTRSFSLGWLTGNIFFLGTCWWLTFAPITYAGFPAPLAYFLLFLVTSAAAVFVGLAAAITAFLLKRLGPIAFLTVPFIWVFTEFARYWITGNDWNAIGYSQAFGFRGLTAISSFGGVLLTSFLTTWMSSVVAYTFIGKERFLRIATVSLTGMFILGTFVSLTLASSPTLQYDALVVVLQPNVPMSGLSYSRWNDLRARHVALAESSLGHIAEGRNPALPGGGAMLPGKPNIVIFPESPMNFMYDDDPETKEFINGFAARNNVSVLFNSAEPDKSNGKYFNSAVMVGPDGREVGQYDKIYLLPFGEAVPVPLDMIVPAFVGSFSYGKEYDLFPLGDAKAGVMICFESHFGQLSRRYVRDGADVLIEMTNDGYLGPTPVLRQHLANAVFRAVETNRPVLRVTNVGITAYINERGEVLDAADSYTEATRVWSVAKSDGSQTFYVKWGDWFAWLCSIVTVGLLAVAGRRRSAILPQTEN